MIGLAAGLTGARAGTPRRRSPTSPKRTSPTPTGSPTRRASRPLVSDRRGANGGLESPASTAPSGAAGLRGGSDRSASRPGLRSFPRRGRRGSRDGSPATCGLLAWCRANRGRRNNLHPTGHDLCAARPANGSGRRRRGPRSRARAFHRRGAGAPPAARWSTLLRPRSGKEQAQQGRRSARPATRAAGSRLSGSR